MAVTKLSDLIIPEVFTQYIIDHLYDSDNLLKSGLITQNNDIADLTAPGNTINVPYIKAVKKLPDNWTDSDDKQSHSIGAGSYLGMKFYQTLTYSMTRLSSLISGAPTADAIAQIMIEDWQSGDEDALIKLLQGVFQVEDVKEAKLMDMTQVDPTHSDFSSAGWLAARTLAGDRANTLTGILVNSATDAMMTNENLKDQSSAVPSNLAPQGTFHGMVITIDDQIPIDFSGNKPVTSAYIFQPNAVSYKRQIYSTETENHIKENGGTSYVSQDSIGVMNVQGVAVKKTFQPAKANFPTIDEYTNGANWEVPAGRDPRNIGVIEYKHTVDPVFTKGIKAAQDRMKKLADQEAGNSGSNNSNNSGNSGNSNNSGSNSGSNKNTNSNSTKSK